MAIDNDFCPMVTNHVELELTGQDAVHHEYLARPAVKVMRNPAYTEQGTGELRMYAHRATTVITGSLKFIIIKVAEDVTVIMERRNVCIVRGIVQPNMQNVAATAASLRAYYFTRRVDTSQTVVHEIELSKVVYPFSCYSHWITHSLVEVLYGVPVGRFTPFIYDNYDSQLVHPRFSNRLFENLMCPKFTIENHELAEQYTSDTCTRLEPQVVIFTTMSAHTYSQPRIPEYAMNMHTANHGSHKDNIMRHLDKVLYRLTGRLSGLMDVPSDIDVNDATNRDRFVYIPTAVVCNNDDIHAMLHSIQPEIPLMEYSQVNERMQLFDTTYPYYIFVVVLNLALYAPSDEALTIYADILKKLSESLRFDIPQKDNNDETPGPLNPNELLVTNYGSSAAKFNRLYESDFAHVQPPNYPQLPQQ